MRYERPRCRPRGFQLARLIDLLASLSAIALLWPVLVLRAVAGRASSGRWIEATPAHGLDCRVFAMYEFSGRFRGRTLAGLFNLLRGDVALGGPRPSRVGELGSWLATVPERYRVRPGLVPCRAPRLLMGIDPGPEGDADLAFVANHRAMSGAALAARWTFARIVAGPAGAAPPQLDVLDVSLTNTTMREAVEWLARRAQQRRRTTVAFANPDCINIAQHDAAYRRALKRADRVFADGIGIRLGARMLGQKMADNVNGTDLFPRLCDAASRSGIRLFLLGARPGVAESAAEAMRARFPGLEIAGTMHGYFAPAQTDAVIRRINASRADVLLVAMGAPHQDLWLMHHDARIGPPVRLGVGGLFDYYSGRIPRAPGWMREAGLEWVWRLRCEPRRLWKRYLVGNPLFLARVARNRVFGSGGRAAIAIRVDGRTARTLAAVRTGLRMRMPAMHERALAVGKRTLDIAASGAATLALSPVLALTALAIRVESPGPVVFRQQRVGRDGATFTMFKFRSMFVDAEARKAALLARNEMDGGVIFKMKDDPRVTRVGRLIRRTSIDELPQLFNVLRGDMSLVGPRPPLPSEVAQYTLKDRGRLDAAPGITCIWQVSGRSEIPFAQQVEMDLEYIDRQSLGGDVRLLARTVPALLRGHGAY
ncbi:MAG: WecB/TagA/CpsF family glycosyltransferase [Steroidobacteraceae bacterium]